MKQRLQILMCFTGPEHEGKPITEEMQAVLDDQAAKWKGFTIKIQSPKEAFTAEEPSIITMYGKNDDNG
ncbi:hypothetical protein JNUCC74_13040 [Cerasibacillus sp. JNUCC 74]